MTVRPIYGNDLPDGHFQFALSQEGEIVTGQVTIGIVEELEPPVITSLEGGAELVQIAAPQPYGDALPAIHLALSSWQAQRPSGEIVAIIGVTFEPLADGEVVATTAASSAAEDVAGTLYFDLAGEDTQSIAVTGPGGDPITVGSAANIPPSIGDTTPSTISIVLPSGA